MSGASAGKDPLSPNTTPLPNRNSNREALRLETLATRTKQSTAPHSNREKEACFFGPSRGGCFSPPAVRPRLRRRAPPPKIQIPQVSSLKNSNREPLRLGIDVTQTKQTIQHHSNREKEACLSNHDHIACRPSLKNSNREPLRLEIDVTQTKQTTRHHSNREKEACLSNHDHTACRPNLKISNREPLRLEIDVTQTKQTIRHHSNREKEAWFSAPVGEGALALPPFGPVQTSQL
jgi:hypothetical protein